MEIYLNVRYNIITRVFIFVFLVFVYLYIKIVFERMTVRLCYIYYVVNEMNEVDWYVLY